MGDKEIIDKNKKIQLSQNKTRFQNRMICRLLVYTLEDVTHSYIFGYVVHTPENENLVRLLGM